MLGGRTNEVTGVKRDLTASLTTYKQVFILRSSGYVDKSEMDKQEGSGDLPERQV